jgi:hypothetical protein
LKEHNTVFKLIGPVLVKQEQAEAKSNVGTRIDFIKGELYVFLNISFHESTLYNERQETRGCTDKGIRSQRRKTEE